MQKITKDNYFDHNNRGLHQSSIKDYFLCPNYFHRKNVLNEMPREEKKSWKKGSICDDILTEIDSVGNYAILEDFFNEKGDKLDGRSKIVKDRKNELEAQGKIVIDSKDYENIMRISDEISKSSAYKEMRATYNMQEIIQLPMDLGEHFDCIVGKMDFFTIDENGVCYLNDMKTTRSIDDNKFYFACKEYGYFFQLFVYSVLLKYKYPEIKSFQYSILAAETSEPYRVKLFTIPVQYIESESDRFFYAIDGIKDGLFDKKDASLQNPTLLCAPSDRADFINNNEI